MIEKKYRIEDALNATRAAIEEGIIPGGGSVLYRISEELAAVSGGQLMSTGCSEPLRRISQNANVSFDVVKHRLRDGMTQQRDYGWNAATDQCGPLLDSGVIDPVKVTRTAIENAVSVAISFLTLDAAVYEE